MASLAEIKTNYINMLSDLVTNPKPSYTVHNRSFSWTEYQRYLLDAIDKLNDLIIAEDPYVIITREYL